MLKCLIVDDDELGRELVAHYLKDIAVCDRATDGNQAVHMFRESMTGNAPYNLIILDIVMPEKNGHDAAMEIRQLEKNQGDAIEEGVPIIVLSSLHTPADIIQSYMSARSAAHLIKPVTLEKLLKTLRKLELIHDQT